MEKGTSTSTDSEHVSQWQTGLSIPFGTTTDVLPSTNISSSLYTIPSGKTVDLKAHNTLFRVLQQNTHIVSHYFDLRTQSFFINVMGPAFSADTFWYRQEFAKSRGMIHWHGLCWRNDREPLNLVHQAIERGLSLDESAEELSNWTKSVFGMTTSYPAGADEYGNPRKDLWPPPEGSAPAPPQDKNPLTKLLMDVSESEESLLEDYLLLTNRINLL